MIDSWEIPLHKVDACRNHLVEKHYRDIHQEYFLKQKLVNESFFSYAVYLLVNIWRRHRKGIEIHQVYTVGEFQFQLSQNWPTPFVYNHQNHRNHQVLFFQSYDHTNWFARKMSEQQLHQELYGQPRVVLEQSKLILHGHRLYLDHTKSLYQLKL